MTSRLRSRLRNEENTSSYVTARFRPGMFDDFGRFFVFCDSGVEDAEKIVTAVENEWDNLIANGVSNDELERAKQGYLKNRYSELGSETRLVRLLLGTVARDRDMSFYSARNRKILALEKAAVDQALQKYFKRDSVFVIRAGDFSR